MTEIKITRPLVVINADGNISRLEFRTGEAKPHSYRTLFCPLSTVTRLPCTFACASLASVELEPGLTGLACLSTSPPLSLGIADPEQTDRDLIESLRAGTGFRESLRSIASRKANP